ncbi:MAG: chorismate synthase [Bacteroidales bacterium]|nr:chorismate synthase [Bacteroidales bacterium]
MNFQYNTIGEHYKLTLTGGSHSSFVGGIIEGCPVGLKIDYTLLLEDIDRRKPQKYGTLRKEQDTVVFLKGVKNGVIESSSIEFRIENKNVKISEYDSFQGFFRPSHADYTYYIKYGEDSLKHKDQASARMFLPCVVAGSLAKMILLQNGITINANVEQTGNLEKTLQGDSIGGKVICEIKGVKAGLGEPIFYKIQSMLARSMMSIPSAISFEIGDGLQRAFLSGSEDIDEWNTDFTTKTNHSGGVNAGISNGNPIVFHVGFHPVHTLQKSMRLINCSGRTQSRVINGRHDKAQIMRCPVIVECMAAMVILDLIFMKQQNKENNYE